VAGFRHILAGAPMRAWASVTRMRTRGSRAALILRSLHALALGIAAAVTCTGLAASAPALAQETLAPVLEPPPGYATERHGATRWTYPLAAADEVASLRAYQQGAWQRVTAELGVRVPDQLDIRVALNPEQMRALAPPKANLPGYADGVAFPETGLILLTLTAPESFIRPDMNRVLTHELSHIALARTVEGRPLPRWFSEGVAVHQAGESSLSRIQTLWNGTLRGSLHSLEALSRAFPSSHHQVDLAYAQSADFVEFLLSSRDERYRFHSLLRSVAEGLSFEEAVQANYHVPLGYLEREWRSALQRRFGRWPALFMGLTFVWVLGAALLVAAYIRTRIRRRATLRRWAIEEAPILNAPPAAPPAAAATQSSVDDFFDNRRGQNETGVPTVVHDGQHHTLH
jgi:Peptidase MA superfamily